MPVTVWAYSKVNVSQLPQIADGICTQITSFGDAYSGTNVFATFLAYDRYVILRPSLG